MSRFLNNFRSFNHIGFILILLFGTSSIDGAAVTNQYFQKAQASNNYSAWNSVDVFVGTEGDHGQLYPGATLPFGLVKLSPDTGGGGHAGYDYDNTILKGFSHTRIGGVGCAGAGGDVLIKPALGKSWTDTINKSTERGSPGYYTVTTANGIQAELTVSYRVGFHRYTFPASSTNRLILVNPSQSYAGTIGSSWTLAGSNLITGISSGRNVCGYGFYKLYYAVRFDRTFIGVMSNGLSVWCNFGASATPSIIQVKVGISPISVNQAVIECDNDIHGWNFDAVWDRAKQRWEDALGKIQVSDVSPELEEFRSLFYTCLYRSYLIPVNDTSSSGQYRVAGDETTIHSVTNKSPHYVNYSSWSTWDDFRKYSLISLLQPEIARNIARSIGELYEDGKSLTRQDIYWPVPSVRCEFMSAVLLDAYQKGLVDFNIEPAYEGMTNAVVGNPEVEQPYENFILMRLAELIGRPANEITVLRKKALAYQKYWATNQMDGEGHTRGFFTPTGKVVPKQNVNKVGAYFYEGNLWHYRFFVPHDIQGLVNLRGSREKLSDDLEYYFKSNQHMALNEPPLAYPFLFDYLGKPYLSQYWSRKYITDVVTNLYHNHGRFRSPIVRRVYQKSPDGWLPTMDDDAGTMSSQFVYSALGLYPAVMGEPYYIIGSPLFPMVTLHLSSSDFIIRAIHSSLANRYIQSVTLNGKPYTKTWIRYGDIAKGGELDFVMGASPNPKWGADPSDFPPSLSSPR